MNKRYKIVAPEFKGDFEDEFRDCLMQIREFENSFGKIYKLTIFTDALSAPEFLEKCNSFKEILLAFFDGYCPAYNILSEKPYLAASVMVEAGFTSSFNQTIEYKFSKGLSYTVLENDAAIEVWVGGAGMGLTTGSIEIDSVRAFTQMVELLREEDMTINNVIRQWNYVGEILELYESENKELQNYQVFNEVRGRFYDQFLNRNDFPAATGIGVKIPGVTIDFFAIKPLGEEVRTFPVINKKQENPYVYGQEVLVGSGSVQKSIKQAPQFERARLLSTSQNSTLYLSGTASILGQYTVGVGDVEKQTHITIDHLMELQRSMKHLEQEINCIRDYKYSLLRVYVKKENDLPLVKQICREKFPDVSMIFVQADICRDNLLVEIEGEIAGS
jgi:hypothetical protein